MAVRKKKFGIQAYPTYSAAMPSLLSAKTESIIGSPNYYIFSIKKKSI